MSWFENGSAAEGHHRTLGISGIGDQSSGNLRPAINIGLGAGGGAPPITLTPANTAVTARPGVLPGVSADNSGGRTKGDVTTAPTTAPVSPLMAPTAATAMLATQAGADLSLAMALQAIAKEPDAKKRGELCASLPLVKAAIEAVAQQNAAQLLATEVLLPRATDLVQRAMLGVRLVRALHAIDTFSRAVTHPDYTGGAQLEIPPATVYLVAQVQGNAGLAVAIKDANNLAMQIAEANGKLKAARKSEVKGKLPLGWSSRLAVYSPQCFVPAVNGQSDTKAASWITIPATSPREPTAKALAVSPPTAPYGGPPSLQGLNDEGRKVFATAGNAAFTTVQSFALSVASQDDNWKPDYTVKFVRDYETVARTQAMVAVKARADLICQFMSALTKICGVYPSQTVMRVPATPQQAPDYVGGDFSWLVCPVVSQPDHWKYAASLAYWLAQEPALGPQAAKDAYLAVRKLKEADILPTMAFPYGGPGSVVEKARAAFSDMQGKALVLDGTAKDALAKLPAGLQTLAIAKAALKTAVLFADFVGKTADEGGAMQERQTMDAYIIDVGMITGVKANPPADLSPTDLQAWFAKFVADCAANPPPTSLFAQLKWAATTLGFPLAAGASMVGPTTPELQLAVAVWSELQPQLSQITAMNDVSAGDAALAVAEVAKSGEHMAAANAELAKTQTVKVAIPGSTPAVEFDAQIGATEADFAAFAAAQAEFEKAKKIAATAKAIADEAKKAGDKLKEATGTPPGPSDTPPINPPPPPPPPPNSGLPWGLLAAAIGAKIAFG